jgi:hypothetical protein
MLMLEDPKSAKAYSPMPVAWGRLSEVRELHSMKAQPPTLVASGRLSVLREVQ